MEKLKKPTEPKSYSNKDLSIYNNGFQNTADIKAANEKKKLASEAVDEYKFQDYSKDLYLQGVMDKILNRQDFSYDLNGDALYQQYKDKYIQQGKMAMQDTMGQAAAMTGGFGNSYAATVGNQAYQASLENLNDIVPELYQMAYDKYNQEGQELYNQYGLLTDDKDREYAMQMDEYNRLVADRGYFTDEANNVFARDYGIWNDNRNYDTTQYWNETNFGYGKYRDAVSDWENERSFQEAQRQYNEQQAFNKEQWEWQKANSGSGSGSGSGGGRGSGEAESNTLWYQTGTTDDNGNPIFRNSQGKTQAFGSGINPYTGTKHADAKHGTFSNGYQPNNIGGTKLKNSGMSTSITGKSQTIWEANGKYWLWRGDKNRYEEVDVSELQK